MSSEWRTVSLGQCAELDLGFPFKSADYTESSAGIRLLRGDNIGQGQLRWDGVRRWLRKDGDKLAAYELRENDLVLAMDRPWITAGLKFARVRASDLPSLLVQRVARLRPKAGVDADYLHSVIASDGFTQHIQTITTGTAVPHISGKQIQEYKFNLPDLVTQRSIGSLLIRFDDRITLLRETNATLEAIAQTLFKSWFVDFDPVRAKMEGRTPEGMDEATAALFPDALVESELGLVPSGWRVLPIGEVCTLGRGSSPRPIQNFMGDDIPWIKIADATASDGMFVFKTKEKIKREGASKSTAVAHGDLIMSNSASCGIPVFVELEGCIHDGWLYFKNFNGVSKILVFYWLRHISAHLVSIADGSVQKNLNIGLVSSQPIICPVGPLLDAFDALSQPLLDRIRENCMQAQTLATLRDTLLPRLISGQLRLPEAPAEMG